MLWILSRIHTYRDAVSRGQGLGDNGRNNHFNMHRIVFDHLVDLFPNPSSGPVVEDGDGKAVGSHGYTNGAQGGTGALQLPSTESTLMAVEGSDYFSLCFAEHIPKDVDLVLVELGDYYFR